MGYGSGFNEGQLTAEDSKSTITDSGSIWFDSSAERFKGNVTGSAYTFAFQENPSTLTPSTIQAGFIVFSNSAAESVVFSSSFSVNPVVVVSAQETNENIAVVLTVDSISTSQFSLTSSAIFTGTGHFIAMQPT